MGKTVVAVLVGLTILVGIGYFLTRSEPEVDSPVQEVPVVEEIPAPEIEQRELPPPEPEVVENYALSGALPLLNDSDEVLLNHLRLIATPIRLQLLNNDQLLRKFVLQVENAAKGELVYQHSPLIAPISGIEVVESADSTPEGAALFLIDHESYERYDRYADLAGAVDVSLLLAYYQFYEPLLNEAYMELGYSDGEFRRTFVTAIDQVLAAPIVDGDVFLHQPEVNYEFVDPALESLNTLQKQLMRMGPENTQKIQAVLQQFKARIQ